MGHAQAPYHLEFVKDRNHQWQTQAPSPEHLLVLYIPDKNQWTQIVERMREKNFEKVISHNPYWSRQGVSFADPDGYRIVLQNSSWTL